MTGNDPATLRAVAKLLDEREAGVRRVCDCDLHESIADEIRDIATDLRQLAIEFSKPEVRRA